MYALPRRKQLSRTGYCMIRKTLYEGVGLLGVGPVVGGSPETNNNSDHLGVAGGARVRCPVTVISLSAALIAMFHTKFLRAARPDVQ